MIKIRELIKKFGDMTAVDIPELFIENGTMLGIVGNNGAGKSTLFRLMLDLLQPNQGWVELNGINPANDENWKNFTGAYLDEGFLIDFLTPEEYFNFVAKACNLSKEQLQAKLQQFEAFMAGEIINQKKLIRNFSAGNKQKIGIVAAMLNNPALLILDEPFNFLDPSSQHILKKILTDYHQQTNATILVSSHNLQHTIDISSQIALLEHGRIIKCLENANHSAEAELEAYFNV